MHTPSGDTWAALAYTPNFHSERLGICKGGPSVTRGCVHFGWTKLLGTLLWLLMFRHFPGRKLGNYAETATW